MKSIYIGCFILLLFCNSATAQKNWPRDSVRLVRKLHHVWPVKSKCDYKRFYDLYSNKMKLERLIKDKDSSQINNWLKGGRLTNRDLFDLTYNNLSDSTFNYALLYQVDFSRIKCYEDAWYLSGFGIIFNEDGKASKLFHHTTRGYNLYDKRSLRSVR